MQAKLGTYESAVSTALQRLHTQDIIGRIWNHDYTVWKPESTEIINRLGWLQIAEMMAGNLSQIDALVQSVRAEGYTQALLLGMGGSSLAPEMFREVFGVAGGYLDLAVLDSTSPGAVLAQAESLDLAHTLFVVSTKSGGTVETLSFTKFFYNRVVEQLGAHEAGRHFVAITDPGSKLVDLAQALDFRDVFLNDPHIGGRYSALSYFGLAPAALLGIDLERLLARARRMATACEPLPELGENPGARLGAILGVLHEAGRNKLTLIASPAIASFGDWVEQLVAESTGKEGHGILPVVGEPPGTPEAYGNDRLFVCLNLGGESTCADGVEALAAAGHPVVHLHLDDLYDLGAQMFLWEMATAVASHFLKINPFDQPNVEAAKVLARKMLAEYESRGALPAQTPALEDAICAVYGDTAAETPADAFRTFVEAVPDGGYVALQAYVQPGSAIDAAWQEMRELLRDALHVATTAGYGPRFLHSTGQLHKGDAGRGVFVQFTEDVTQDAAIPGVADNPASLVTFGTLIAAQALGDQAALRDAGRPVLRIHFKGDVAEGLRQLMGAPRD